MKSVAFFRAWKKRGKDKNTTKGKQDVSALNRVVLVPESAPCSPTAMSFEMPVTMLSPPSPDPRVRSQSQDAIAFDPCFAYPRKMNDPFSTASSTSSLVDQEITIHSSPDTSHFPRAPVVWKSSHGPPENAVHGPPSLNLYSPISGASPRSTGGTPVRPPRPPSLNLYPTTTKRPINTGITPRFMADRAITFALPPNPRAIKPAELNTTTRGSSSDPLPPLEDHKERISQPLEEIIHCPCITISPDGSHIYPHRGTPCNEHAPMNPLRSSRPDLLPSASPLRTAHAVLDLSDAPSPHRVYQNGQYTSSTPHILPSQSKQREVPPVPPLPLNSTIGQADDVSTFPLSLFPSPPQSPLFVRRKVAKNLVLRPNPTSSGGPLLPSPPMTSPEYKSLLTPTTSRPQLSPNYSKSCSSFPRHTLTRTISRPLFDPPSTPLPTPPTSPVLPVATTSIFSSSKSLRSARSVNQLSSEQHFLPVMLHTHRSMSSDPPSQRKGITNVTQMRRRAHSRPEAIHEACVKMI